MKHGKMNDLFVINKLKQYTLNQFMEAKNTATGKHKLAQCHFPGALKLSAGGK